ncbi:tape measure protein [Xinfangfangia sp. D13-10-4-6]|uniref:tape measure protein n=1 Tax=Pseudogemmobacter hezensis TaxID=2737662 RepID=UPI0015577C5D|nr:tape measure protein [Pseudogemmobacter hezensis]NPD17600.1 tape measure protein [Pseudogemmobacter hezensis]
MTEIAALGLRADSSSLVVATEDLKKLSRAAGEAEQATEKLAPAEKKAGAAAGEMGGKARKAAADTKKLGDDSRTTEGALHRLAERAGTVAGSLVAMATAAFSVGAYVKLADSWSDMRSTLGAAIGDMDAASGMMNRMLEIAQASYSPLDQTVQMYARNVAVLRDLGKNAGQAADFTESLNHMLVITATKGERAASVQDALSKAMATGRLQADGLETVLANGGRVAQALADELGTTVSGLRDFASQGKITGQVIADAIIKPLEDVRDVAGSMDATVADGFTKVGNSLLALVGNFDQATGASLWFATQLDDLSKWLTALSQTDFAAWADTATASLTLLGQAVLVLAATRITALLISLRAWMVAQNLMTASSIAGAAASRAMAAAMVVHAAGARALGAAMTFVGGPIGIAVGAAVALGLAFFNGTQRANEYAAAAAATASAQASLNSALDEFYRLNTAESWQRAKDEAQAAVDAITKQLEIAQRRMDGTGFMTNIFGYSLSQGAGVDFLVSEVERLQVELIEAQAVLDAMANAGGRFKTAVDGGTAAVVHLTEEQQKALASAQELERSYQQRIDLAQAEQQYGRDSAQYMQVQLQYERAIQHAKIDALDVSNQQKAAIKAQYDEMMRLEAKTQGWKVEIGKLSPPLQAAYDWLVKIRDTQPGDSWLSTAIANAASLATELWDAVRAKGALTATEVDAAGNPVIPGLGGVRPNWRESTVDLGDNSKIGGGGGGGSSDRQSGLEALITEFATERELLEEWYGTRQALINSYTDQELDFLGGKHGAIERLEAEHKQRLKDLNDQHRQMELEAQRSMYGELGNLLGIFSGKSRLAAIAQIGINTALRLAETAQNTAAASMRALAELGPIAGPPAAAKIAAYGKVQMGLIAAAGVAQGLGSGRGSSGSSGGAGGGANATAQSVQSTPVAVTIQGLDPDSLYSGKQVIGMTDAVQKELKRRGVVLTYSS